MRKIILLSFVGISSHLFAQKSFFGLNVGVNVANQRIAASYTGGISPDYSYVYFLQNNIKPSFSVFYQYSFSGSVAMRINAQYMGMGYISKGSSLDKVDIDYLTFPVSVHYTANKHLSLNAGPYLSFTLDGTKINNQPITSVYHKNDFGFSFGGEHCLYRNLSIGINYVIGLKNVLLDDTINGLSGSIGTVKYTNRALQLTLIYKFKKSD